jgi:hypothetical protein
MTVARVKITDAIWMDVDSDKEVDLFKGMARVQEIFQHSQCGKCGNKDVRFVCRQDKDDNDWLEIVCQSIQCRAKLVFGQVKGKGGEIYPKHRWSLLSDTQKQGRADEEAYAEQHSGFLPNKGWFVYKKKD